MKQTWTETQESGANAAQTLTRAAEAGRTHIVTHFTLSAAVAAFAGGVPKWEIKDGTTIVFQGAGAADIDFGDNPLAKFTAGTAINVAVAAGGSTITTRANLVGYTV